MSAAQNLRNLSPSLGKVTSIESSSSLREPKFVRCARNSASYNKASPRNTMRARVSRTSASSTPTHAELVNSHRTATISDGATLCNWGLTRKSMHSPASPHGVCLSIQKFVQMVYIDAASGGKCQKSSDEISSSNHSQSDFRLTMKWRLPVREIRPRTFTQASHK